ncbi:MAG TPA: cupin domain-containing protein [Ideonella sp.]|nr:cupin domain-containing protein [Ideonella sp.]
MPELNFIHHPLPATGRTLAADSDHLVARTSPGALLLIHLPPGAYAFEHHAMPEYIVCLQGSLQMEAEGGARCSAAVGEVIEVPPGLSHRFAADCDAVVLTLAQKAPAAA